MLAGAHKSITDKLQQVLNATDRIITGTSKYYCGLSHLLHTELHYTTSAVQTLYHRSPVSAEQSTSIFGELLHSCLRNCQLSPSAISRLPSAVRAMTLMFGCRAFSVASPSAWNSLPDSLRDPTPSVNCFRHDLQTFLFSGY